MNRIYYLSDTERYYISEDLLLENPNQAKKYLKKYGLNPDTNEKGQKLLDDILNITKGDEYTHLLLNFYYSQRIDLDTLRDLYDYIKRNRGILNDLDKPVVNYDSYVEIFENIEDYIPNIEYSFDELHKKLTDDLGFSHLYNKVLDDKIIQIKQFDFGGDNAKLLIEIFHDPYYFKKTKQEKPKDLFGWVIFDTLVKYVQHYSMSSINENNQLKRIKQLIKK